MSMLAISCTKHYAIEDRARQQILASMDDHLSTLDMGANDWRIENLKTVYVNDSLCMLQCTVRFHDAMGQKVVRDERYYYMIDMMMSRIEGRPVYLEEYRNVLCMPDDLIKQCRKDIKDNNENVYNSCFGKAIAVRYPFDAEKK